MTVLIHPAKKDFKLEHILSALSDPIRLKIVQGLYCLLMLLARDRSLSAYTNPHFQIISGFSGKQGLIKRTSKKGVSHHNTLRLIELESRFPKLLETILKYSYMEA